jgi:hypothetical protein
MSGQPQDKNPSQMADVVTSVRLPRKQHDDLRAQAVASHRTLSGELRRIIALHLDETEKAA